MTCKNCHAIIEGKFCADCGQKTEIHRVTLGHLAHEFFHAMTHADKGFLLLVKELLKRPGHVAREYLEGKRKQYFNPLSFLVITTAASAYISYKSGYYEALSQPRGDMSSASPQYKETMDIMVHNGKMLGLFLIVPLISFFSWIFFRRPRFNFAEHFVLQSYLVGLTYIFTALIFVPLFLPMPRYVAAIDGVFHILFFVYMVTAYRQFFGNNIFLTILKSVLIMAFFITFYWLSIFGYVIIKHQIVH